ncbi:AraC family transcriptional regulator [Octadecabacter arcticus 238]|jgi:AraC family carnitine catabolism transcriptional activator|uniref:AraC family transcriptional regulator n=1 Tax=Octadecabacter arcticus 238 TaxID=391616 RepID=M9RRM0_9RHOB|nr:GlxA family transcriptional regulator [Octadecabacter arcticus]AGI74373.1 AraC family transcriptional regulator [Octadecabacter arcticus 238]
MIDQPPLHRYGVLLVPGFSNLAVSLVTEPLFIANWLAGKTLFGWTTLSADGFAVSSSSGNLFAVDAPLSGKTRETFDTVFVVASFEARNSEMNARIVDWLRKAARNGVRLGGIETGSEILMDAGLLLSESIPAHWYNAKGSNERHPDLKITETLFDVAGGQPLSAGGMATADMMLELIAQTAGDSLASEVGRHLLLDARRPGSRPQPSVKVSMPPDGNSPHHEDPVARAHTIMEQRIEDPLSCVELADMVGVSLRHLQRLFRARLGRGMEATYRELRLATAHQLVQQTNISLTEIAFASGFSSLEVLSRTYRSRFGVPPSRDRQQTLDATVCHSFK